MKSSLWSGIATVIGIACLTLCAWQGISFAEDAHPEPEKKPAEAAAHTPEGDHPHEAEAGHGAEHGAKPNPIDFDKDLALWTLVTFIIMLVILKLVAWKPLLSALEARETGIFSNVEKANHAREEAEKAFADYQAKLQKAEDEVRQILAEARKAAETARADMLATTQKEVATLKDRALAEIDQVRVQALEELFKHMASTVTKATEQVIKRSLTPADQDRLVSDAVSQFAKR